MVAIGMASVVVAVPTSGSTFDVTISGIGTPVAADFEWVGATVDATAALSARFCKGFTDGSNQRCGTLFSEDGTGASSTDTGFRYNANAVAVMTATTTEAESSRLSFNSWVTDGIRLNIDVAAASGWLLRVTFYYGTDWTAEIFEFASPAVLGNTLVVNTGIVAHILSAASVYNTAAVSTSGANARMGIGWAARYPSITQGGYTYYEDDRPTVSTEIVGRIYDDALICRLTTSGGTGVDSGRQVVTAWTDTNFSIQTQNAASSFNTFGLALGTNRRPAAVIVPAGSELNTDATGDRSISVGFRGKYARGLASFITTKNSMTTGDQGGKFCLGFSDASDQGVVAVQAQDNAATSSTRSFSDDAVFLEPINNSGSADFTATLTAFGATDLTINVAAASASERLAVLLVISETQVLYPGGIASGSAFGTVTLQATITLSPGGIATGSAFGTPTLQATITLSPGGIASGSAFGTPTLTAGAVILSPGGVATGSAFGTPTLQATITLSPVGIASGSAFGTPTLTAGAVTLSPGGIASGSAFGAPTLVQVVAGIVLSPEGIASTSTFGLPFVTGGVIPTTMKKRIHDALCERAHLGTFIAATYPVDDEGCVLEQGLQVQPKSVEVNELKGSFQTEHRHGMDLILDRSRWLWLMILRFDQEVVAELFERSLEDEPVMVCRDPADPTSRQARLSRVDCDYVHPPRGNPSNGTELRYRFEAVLSPK